ncbi:regulator of nonsense transcript protein [Parasponia andersonii]|uniref:Regulator of nonsense transcript protein n=1 Tax=Parasponia andersonii TaxID=3476 RepID=A0A2P5CJR1_PARAD|nr:regulator of nonsense transcript protein [Parasponia andersonii]
MKVLDWMHQKFRHNSIKPFKDLNIGNSCIRLSAQTSIDDQDTYTKPTFGCKDGFTSLKRPKQEEENYFSQFEAKKEEKTSTTISELFHGFLTIGTLGSEASINEPETPTFATPSENITDGRIKVTENDLKLINYELEKFLEAESKEEGSDESSARISNVSTITLGGKQTEGAEEEDYWKTVVCPLQGYLFGSSIELPDTRTELKKEKASLAELFHRTKITTENCTEKCESEEISDKHKQKSAMHFMKKMIKKLRPSSKSSPHSACGDIPVSVSAKKELGNATDSVSSKKKLHKVLRMFHRKIHPESSVAAREFIRSKKCKAKITPNESGCTHGHGNLIPLGVENRRFPQVPTSMKETQCGKNNMNSTRQSSLSCNNLGGKEEHWIKIDEDCK